MTKAFEHYKRALALNPGHLGAHEYIDLRLATVMVDLGVPERKAHHPVNDATMAALAFVKLRALAGR